LTTIKTLVRLSASSSTTIRGMPHTISILRLHGISFAIVYVLEYFVSSFSYLFRLDISDQVEMAIVDTRNKSTWHSYTFRIRSDRYHTNSELRHLTLPFQLRY
jgi:hypothetical protein